MISIPASFYKNRNGNERSGVVLLAVLVVVVVLSLAAYQYSELMLEELRVTESYNRSAQAKALADSGLHFTVGLLSDPEAYSSTMEGNPYDNPTLFYMKADNFAEMGGRFAIVAPHNPEDLTNAEYPFRFGVTDESSKLNLNGLMKLDEDGTSCKNILLKLPNMTDDIAESIVCWMAPDGARENQGNEDQFYSTLEPPYKCKRGPLDSLEELLLVRGVTPDLLFGHDFNRSGIPSNSQPGSDSGFERGWSAFLTVYSREPNVDADGAPRVNINKKLSSQDDVDKLIADLETVFTDSGVDGQALAYYIVAGRLNSVSKVGQARAGSQVGSGGIPKEKLVYRNRASSISSLYKLINSQVSLSSSNRRDPPTVYPSPLNDPNLVKILAPLIFDKLTTMSEVEIPARVNLKTAPITVLRAIPGLDEEESPLPQAILDARRNAAGRTEPLYSTPAWLMIDQPVLFPPEKMESYDKYLTGKTTVYRVQSIGMFDNGGPTSRVEAIVEIFARRPRYIQYRDLTELGKAYDFSEPSNR